MLIMCLGKPWAAWIKLSTKTSLGLGQGLVEQVVADQDQQVGEPGQEWQDGTGSQGGQSLQRLKVFGLLGVRPLVFQVCCCWWQWSWRVGWCGRAPRAGVCFDGEACDVISSRLGHDSWRFGATHKSSQSIQ